MYTHYWMYIEDIYIYAKGRKQIEGKLQKIYTNYRRYLYIDIINKTRNVDIRMLQYENYTNA